MASSSPPEALPTSPPRAPPAPRLPRAERSWARPRLESRLRLAQTQAGAAQGLVRAQAVAAHLAAGEGGGAGGVALELLLPVLLLQLQQLLLLLLALHLLLVEQQLLLGALVAQLHLHQGVGKLLLRPRVRLPPETAPRGAHW